MASDHVAVDHAIMGGVPCIAETRIPVETILAMLAEGMASEEILAAYPQLTEASVRAALRFAADAMRIRELPLQVPA